MQKIIPCLWFDNQAEEAVNFYTSIFKNSKIASVTRYGEAGAEVSGRPKGTVMTVTFQLDGQEFMASNGGPVFKFTEAISFLVDCKTQKELDELWEKLSEGGKKGQWLAKGQVWRIMADRSPWHGQDVERQGHEEIGTSDEGCASNEET
jgi:predicted 3-demethylubiquinone-9 3-methyltransferase (glyoxalase superfamily)